jgi:hypothetical protein
VRARWDTMFESLRADLLAASDFDVHFAALCIFHELTARRLGGKMTLDTSGNAVVVVDSPVVKKSRAKTPKKIASPKQDAVDAMFDPALKLMIGEELLDAEAEALEAVVIADSQGSVSPDPPSDPRPIPKKASAKGGAAAKSRE